MRRDSYTIVAASVKVTAGKGTVGLPDPVARLIDYSQRWRRAVLVSFGSPYIGSQVPHLRSYLLAWSGNGVSEWAAARALSSQVPITGRLPVSLPPAYAIGWGIELGVRSEQ
jgi:hypothetical protein